MKVCLCALTRRVLVVLMERRMSFCFPGSRSVVAGSLVSACGGECCDVLDAALATRIVQEGCFFGWSSGRTGVLVGENAETKKQ